MGKLMSLNDAIKLFVHDGDTVALEGFTHLIPFAAAHEIIRQGIKNLTLVRLTPDIIYDQMVAAGCAKKLVFSWAGNPGVGSLYALRRAVEKGIPNPVEIEEYSHFGMVMRYFAGASNLPFMPINSYIGSDLPIVNKNLKKVKSPYDDREIYVVPPIKPDVTIIHAQRADKEGNVQIWGLTGVQVEAAFAAKYVIVTVEEIVDSGIIRKDPMRTVIPGLIVDAIVHEPFGAHPSYVQGYYDRDNEFYIKWNTISKTHEELLKYLDEWIFGVKDRAEYVYKMGKEWLSKLKVPEYLSGEVNYGLYKE